MKSFGYEEVVWWSPSLWNDTVAGMVITLVVAFVIIGMLKGD